MATMASDEQRRTRMVERDLMARGLRDERVLEAMRAVPREAFVPAAQRASAWDDRPLPIGGGQTISQPYIVALMCEALRLRADDRVLEIGCGSGYSAAVLARLAAHVDSIERRADLAESAATRLAELGVGNVTVHAGDGTLGWPQAAPYDAIVVTAGGPEVPPALLQQLSAGGRLVMPVGDHRGWQDLVGITRHGDGTLARETLGEVAFVPLIGAQGWPEG